MALEELVHRLDRDLEQRVQAIERKADATVRALEAEARREAGEASAQRLAVHRAALEAASQRTLAAARQRTRAEALTARRALVRRVLERAAAHAEAFATTPAYRAALPAHAEEALAYLAGLQPVLRCRPELAPLLAPLVKARRDVVLAPAAGVPPGVVAEASNGSVRVDNTLPARLERLEARLTIELLRAVEGGAS